MINLQQYIKNTKIYQSDFNALKAIPVFLEFFFPKQPLTHLSAFPSHRNWTFLSHLLRLLSSDKLSPVRNYQEFPPVHFLHLKITFHIKEGERSVIWDVTCFHRLFLPLVHTLRMERDSVPQTISIHVRNK